MSYFYSQDKDKHRGYLEDKAKTREHESRIAMREAAPGHFKDFQRTQIYGQGTDIDAKRLELEGMAAMAEAQGQAQGANNFFETDFANTAIEQILKRSDNPIRDLGAVYTQYGGWNQGQGAGQAQPSADNLKSILDSNPDADLGTILSMMEQQPSGQKSAQSSGAALNQFRNPIQAGGSPAPASQGMQSVGRTPIYQQGTGDRGATAAMASLAQFPGFEHLAPRQQSPARQGGAAAGRPPVQMMQDPDNPEHYYLTNRYDEGADMPHVRDNVAGMHEQMHRNFIGNPGQGQGQGQGQGGKQPTDPNFITKGSPYTDEIRQKLDEAQVAPERLKEAEDQKPVEVWKDPELKKLEGKSGKKKEDDRSWWKRNMDEHLMTEHLRRQVSGSPFVNSTEELNQYKSVLGEIFEQRGVDITRLKPKELESQMKALEKDINARSGSMAPVDLTRASPARLSRYLQDIKESTEPNVGRTLFPQLPNN